MRQVFGLRNSDSFNNDWAGARPAPTIKSSSRGLDLQFKKQFSNKQDKLSRINNDNLIEGKSVKIPRKTSAIFLITLLLFVYPSAQACQKAEVSQKNCCCCGNSSQFDTAEQRDCSCQMGENKPEEKTPAVITSNSDTRPENFLATSEIELIYEHYLSQLNELYSNSFLPPSREPPLYLLNSSFLI